MFLFKETAVTEALVCKVSFLTGKVKAKPEKAAENRDKLTQFPLW